MELDTGKTPSAPQRRYLTEENVKDGVRIQLEKYGGGDFGMLKPEGLDSAINTASLEIFGRVLQPTRFDVAAKYLYSLLFNHAFQNGNKRAGLGTALEFLYVNGMRVECTNEQLTKLVLDAFVKDESRVEQPQMTAFFRAHVKRVACREADIEKALGQARAWMHAKYAPTFEILAQ